MTVKDLHLDESALTGESLPVDKATHPLPPGTGVADRRNMAHTSTLVVRGLGTGVATATGSATEIGRIHHLMGEAEGVETPLTRKITWFSQILTVAVLVLAALTFAIGVARGEPIGAMVTAAVALAVGAIPEGLPAVVTVTLAIGVARMARRRAIIRHLPAVETLGSTTVICTDKTGTLSENEMTVTAVIAGGEVLSVSGTGYGPTGEVTVGGAPVDPVTRPGVRACLLAGLVCNDSQVVLRDGRWQVIGDPTEGALITSAAKADLAGGAVAGAPRIDGLPFDSERQYMATLHGDGTGTTGTLYVKGAIERVLDLCGHELDQDGRRRPLRRAPAPALAAAEDLGRHAFASGPVHLDGTDLTEDRVSASELTFLRLQAMHDPPRAEAIAAVAACRSAGIEVKMITGDHAATAAAIAREVGLCDVDGGDCPAITGAELAACTEEELVEVASRAAVFARVSPEQKLRLVEALLVLADDDFASIEAAVDEGRGVFDNLTKFIVWALPTSMGEGLVILAAIVTGTMLPLLPVQVLWVNMTTAVALGLTLAVEPRERDIMRRPPRPPSQPLLSGALVMRILLVSGLMVIGAFGLFRWEQSAGATLEEALTVAVHVFVLVELTYLFNCRSLERSTTQGGLFRNRWMWGGVATMIVLQVALTYLTVLNDLFRTAPIGGMAWLRVAAVALAAYGIVGVEKWLRRRRSAARR